MLGRRLLLQRVSQYIRLSFTLLIWAQDVNEEIGGDTSLYAA